MAISFVAAGAVATGTNPVVAVPAGYQQADLLVLTVSVAAAVAPTTPGGWTLVGSTTTTPRIYIYRKFAGGTESSVTVTVASTTTKAVMCAYRGVSNTDTISTFAAATSTTIATNTLTTTYANEYVISVYAMTTGADTWTAPGSTTTRVDSAGTAAVAGVLIVDELQAAAGLSTARTATSSASKALCAGSFSIIPSERYWRGGAGTWDTTSTTNWSFSSGGAGGAPVPTAQDNVFFDQAGTYTVTMTGALTCLDITVSAGTVTFATGTSPTLNVGGSMTLLAGTVWSSGGAITFSSTSTGRTVTTNGVVLRLVVFNGSGGAWTLGSPLTVGTSGGTPASQSLTITQGTFNTSNHNVTCTAFLSTGSSTRVLNLGSSTITAGGTLFGGFTVVDMTSTGMTLNPGTSTFTPVGPNRFQGGNLTYANILIPNTNITITGVNTFNNFQVPASASAGVIGVFFSAAQTINGTLSTTGTAGNRRVLFSTATYGISYDLVVNATPSLTDADFLGIYVRGTAAPISGTRIGNRGECRGITFDTPKTVYWNLSGAQNWSANGWATTSTGAPSTDNFPLPQDTATFTNAGSVTGTITLDTAIGYVPNVDMSGRTSAMTLGTSNATTVYGNWTNGSGTAFTGTAALTFSGGGTQTIDSAGKTFSCPITVDTYGGTVQLSGSSAANGALNIGSNTLTVTNGTFNTQNYNVTALALSSSNSNVRTITLGSSTLTVTINGGIPINFGTSTNLTFNSGTSQITVTSPSDNTFNGGGKVFYNVSFTGTTAGITFSITGTNTFNNLTIPGPSSAGLIRYSFFANQTINGTLASTGTTAVRRIFVRSDTLGTARTFTVGTLSATDCDFRDITIAGAAAGSSPTRAGNCGGNSGITFSSKTVYWNLAGAQNWSATGWCPTSGGTPDINQFPLAQDTAVFDNTGSVTGTITIETAWNIGTFDASARTSAMTLATNTSDFNPAGVYGDWKFGTGVTSSSTTGTITFFKNGTQTITSNGVQFGCPVTVNHPSGTVQLADALSLGSNRTLTLTSGTFDAVTYNVTTGLFSNGSTANTLKMGSGTWTLSGGTGTVWNCSSAPTLIVGTSTIVLSDTSTSGRTFDGGGRYYNKLTIGGTTGTSTLTIFGANTFGELASTKTVAHTISFSVNITNTVGKWAVTGTVGNVVTVNSTLGGTVFTLSIAGPANSGIDYLSVRDCTVSTTSPGEFYVGANSTNVSGNTRVIFTATPAARTLYWVGGSGNWSDTARWSTSSGVGSGAAIPTSLDAVVFDSASNATAYLATIDAGVTLARCASFTMAGPLSGNVTFAGSVGIAFHGNVSFAATGITRTYTGAMQWAGNSSYTFDTNGLVLASACTVVGVGSTWTLARNTDIGASTFTVTYGNFNTSASNYALTCTSLSSSNTNVRSISLNGSTITLSANTPITFTTTTNLTFTAGTSTLFCSSTIPTFNGGSLTFYNVSFTSNNTGSITIDGANSFNNLSSTGIILSGLKNIVLNANQTVTGTLTFSAGSSATMRHFIQSNTIGTTRTITAAAFSGTDVDFRDIAVTGAAAPVSGTRLGDCKGNSGITFTAAANKYWNLAAGGNWSDTGWALTSGGGVAANNFPLAQDTCFFEATGLNSGATITINQSYNIGTINMSARTANTMTLSTNTVTTTPTIYGNWINGTGTTLSGSGRITYAGRGTQTITSAGKTFTQPTTVNSLGGSVTLLDAWVTNAGTQNNNPELLAGTFDAAGYNVTLANTGSYLGVTVSGTLTKTLAIGSGTWTLSGTGSQWNISSTTNLTVTGTGTISLTNASTKQFNGGGVSYTNITLDQGGAGTLTIIGNHIFKDITNSYSATGATTIALGGTTQTVTQFTGTGAVGKVLTISGTSAGSPGTLIMSGASKATTSDYLTISNVRAYSLVDTWYAGNNSTNSGSLGWYFVASGGTTYNVTVSDSARGSETVVSVLVTTGAISESAQASDSVSSSFLFLGAIAESAQGSDQVSSVITVNPAISESAQGSDQFVVAASTFNAALADTAQGSDAISSLAVFNSSLSDTAQGADTVSSLRVLPSSVNETAQISDSVLSVFAFSTAINESVRGSDTVSALSIFRSSISDTARASDAISSLAIFNSSLSDIARASNSVNSRAVFNASLLDTAQGADTVSSLRVLPGSISEFAQTSDQTASNFVVLASASETARTSDTVSALSVFSSAAIEAVSGIDSFSAAATFNSLFIDSLQGSDSVSAKQGFKTDINEAGRVTDANSATATFRTTLQEAVQASDQTSSLRVLPGAVSETVRISESIAAQKVLFPVISESARASDTAAAIAVFVSSISEQATGQDAFTVAASTFNASFAETVRGADTTVGFITFPTNVSESAQGVDSGVGFIVFPASITESAQGADQFSALATFVVAFADTVRAADTMTVAPSIFNAAFVETVRVSDVPNNTAVLLSSVTESILVYDAVLGVYQWNPIPTDQPGNWQAIPTDASGSWQAIDTNQSGGWQLIPTSQGAGWQLIDDSQDPQWQNILTVPN